MADTQRERRAVCSHQRPSRPNALTGATSFRLNFRMSSKRKFYREIPRLDGFWVRIVNDFLWPFSAGRNPFLRRG